MKTPRIIQNVAVETLTKNASRWRYTKGATGDMQITVYVRNKKTVFQAIDIDIVANDRDQLVTRITVNRPCGDKETFELKFDR